MKNLNRPFKVAVALVLMTGWMIINPANASDFVSFNGKFRITLPDDWERADYMTVDYWLNQAGSDQTDYHYEAVFVPKGEAAFAEADYLILTVDTIGQLSDAAIDSVLDGMYDIFGGEIKYQEFPDFVTRLETDAPTYDASNHTAAVISTLTQPDNSIKKSLLVMKFYDRGIANFYFYSPDSTWNENKLKFASVVQSFSTDSLDTSGEQESVKVADIKDKSGESKGIPVAIWGGLIAVLAAIIIARRRKRK